MKKVKRSTVYTKWLKKLRDRRARLKILTRIDRLAAGNPGDHRFLSEIYELRIDYGPGYRVYYKDTGRKIIILLCGGDKDTQDENIEKARNMAKAYREE